MNLQNLKTVISEEVLSQIPETVEKFPYTKILRKINNLITLGRNFGIFIINIINENKY
jgi:hypothetical protein